MRLNTDIFIKKAKEIHGDKYDYSKVNYINSKTKVCIICPVHGEFWVLPHSHLQGCGCHKCSVDERKITYQDFIKRAREKHGDKYDYSKVNFDKITDKICIICPIHGEFQQKACSHLLGYGCKKCANHIVHCKNSFSNEEVKEKLKEIYGDKYDYSKVNYINSKKKIKLICPIHGEIEVLAYKALNGYGCPECRKEESYKKLMTSNEDWITKAREVHHDRYDYSLTQYNGYYNKIKIICPIHGEFEQIAYDHIQGKGCPKCKLSKMEKEWMNYLTDNNIAYDYQYRPSFLKQGRSQLSLDFYLPEYNIAIECQGVQHFRYVKFFDRGHTNNLYKRDITKLELCKKNHIKLFYFTNLKEYNFFIGEKVYHSIDETMKDINNN